VSAGPWPRPHRHARSVSTGSASLTCQSHDGAQGGITDYYRLPTTDRRPPVGCSLNSVA
jgi:hypothetical protein